MRSASGVKLTPSNIWQRVPDNEIELAIAELGPVLSGNKWQNRFMLYSHLNPDETVGWVGGEAQTPNAHALEEPSGQVPHPSTTPAAAAHPRGCAAAADEGGETMRLIEAVVGQKGAVQLGK